MADEIAKKACTEPEGARVAPGLGDYWEEHSYEYRVYCGQGGERGPVLDGDIGEEMRKVEVGRAREGDGAARKWLEAGLDLKCAPHIWRTRAVTDYGRTQVFRCRFNRLMTNDLLHKWNPKRYTDDKCEICKAEGGGRLRDGVRHALLQCQHPVVHGLVTKRHDRAVHEVAKAVERGKKGGECMLVNAKRGERGKGAEETVPGWMLYDDHSETHVAVEPSEDGVVHNKPDMVLVEGLDYNEEVDRFSRRFCTVHIVEVGYCWDYAWRDKQEAKVRAYQKLREAMLDAGWSDVKIHAVPVGATGLMGEEVRKVWDELGLDKAGADRLCRRLMDVTWEWLVKILRSRYAALNEVRRANEGNEGRAWDVG